MEREDPSKRLDPTGSRVVGVACGKRSTGRWDLLNLAADLRSNDDCWERLNRLARFCAGRIAAVVVTKAFEVETRDAVTLEAGWVEIRSAATPLAETTEASTNKLENRRRIREL